MSSAEVVRQVVFQHEQVLPWWGCAPVQGGVSLAAASLWPAQHWKLSAGVCEDEPPAPRPWWTSPEGEATSLAAPAGRYPPSRLHAAVARQWCTIQVLLSAFLKYNSLMYKGGLQVMLRYQLAFHRNTGRSCDLMVFNV